MKRITKSEYNKLNKITERLSKLGKSMAERRGIIDYEDYPDDEDDPLNRISDALLFLGHIGDK